LYKWSKRFEKHGPAGLMDDPKGGPRGSRLPDITKRTILMLKEAHPEYGCERISYELMRGPALGASPSAVSRVLHEAGYVLEEKVTKPHPDRVRRFEREKPNQLWQTDIFTFMLKRQNRRVYLVGFMDDHSRFMVGYSIDPTANTTMVLNALRTAISNYQAPESILTDNGPQYVTWRGKSAFTKECEHRGIKQIVARPRHPRTLGKIERFWGTLWRGLVETAIFADLEDARRRIGLFMDHYNFQRPHSGIKGLTPAERYFGVGEEVLKTLKARVQANALEIARNGLPRKPFYLAGQVDGEPFSLHAKGGKFFVKRGNGEKQEVDLEGGETDAQSQAQALCPDGSSPVDPSTDHVPEPGDTTLSDGLESIAASLEGKEEAHHGDD
jgi:transposase InsO family protein